MNYFAADSISQAKIVTDVVPSPTSSSYDFEISTKILAAGCPMSKRFKIVAPSLDIVWPLYVSNILSIPQGPSVVLITSETAWQALMFEIIWFVP